MADSTTTITPGELRAHADDLSPSGNYWVSDVLNAAANKMEHTVALSEARDDLLELIAHEVAGLRMDDEGVGAKDIYAAITKFRSAREKAINDG